MLLGVLPLLGFETDDEANYDEGDWNGDGLFSSSDIVFAFQAGNYSLGAQPLATGFAAATEVVFTEDNAVKRVVAFVG